MARIYVSSTFEDLKDCREIVRLALRRLGHEDVAMEYYVAGSERPLDRCLKDVRESDLYVGIFAWRYGFVPPDQDLSITELEYREAGKTGRPCLCFLLDEDAPWPRSRMDRDPTRVESLRDALREKKLVSFFTEEKELSGLVATAVTKALEVAGLPDASPTASPTLDVPGYAKKMVERYGHLDLDALTPPQKDEHLRILLRSVFVEPTVREDRPPIELPKEVWKKLEEKGEIEEGEFPEGLEEADLQKARSTYQEKPIRPILDALASQREKGAVILGDPGSGKSTFARYVLLSLLRSDGDPRVRAAYPDCLPLIVELREYAGLRAESRCDTFLEFLDYLGRTEGWCLTKESLQPHLASGAPTLFILDGLDELFDPRERETIMRRIAALASRYPHLRVLVTSRIIGYAQSILMNAGFGHYTLQDLDRRRVEEFARLWYGLALRDPEREAPARLRRMLSAFDDSASIRQLAGNPMLLTIMAIIGKHQDLPRERWKLYDHAASVLIEHWDVNKHLRAATDDAEHLGEEDKKELLRRIAYRMQSDEGLAGNYITRESLAEELEGYFRTRHEEKSSKARALARSMIEQLRVRNFILSLFGADVFGFVHRSFLEYFCASEIVRKFEKTQELSLDDLKTEYYDRHWEDEAWHEVLRLVAGMIDEKKAGELVDHLATGIYTDWPRVFGDRPPLNLALAVQCFGEIRSLPSMKSVGELLLRRATRLLDHGYGIEDEARNSLLLETIVPAVESVGHHWPGAEGQQPWFLGVGLVRAWQPLSEVACRIAGAVLRESEGVQRFLLDAAHSSDRRLSTPATDVIRGIWAVAPPERDRLLAYSTAWKPSIRAAALAGLVEHWPREHTRTFVLNRAEEDEHEVAREEAVRALVVQWPDESTRSFLLEHAIDDEDRNVRREAIRGLLTRWPAEKTRPLLLKRAAEAENPTMRMEAVSALVAYLPDEDTRTLLMERANKDESWRIRQTAVRALAARWPDERTRSLLGRCAAKGDWAVQFEAIPALVAHWRDEETGTLLRNLAAASESAKVREVAVRALATHWPDTLSRNCLRERAAGDENGNVREQAIRGLVSRWPDEENRKLLLERAAEDEQWSLRQEAIRALVARWPDDETRRLLQKLAIEDSQWNVRREAIRALVGHWSGEDTRLLLQERIGTDENGHVRQETLKSLVTLRPDERSRTLVRERAVVDESGSVRKQAIRDLVAHWPDGDTRSFIRERATEDDDWSARQAALRALLAAWPDEDTRALLRLRAAEDEQWNVRQAALRSLSAHWPDDGTRAFLRQRAALDMTASVRQDAVRGLLAYAPDGEDRTLFRDRAALDENVGVRQEAVRALVARWPDEGTRTLLQDLAARDGASSVRVEAVQTLLARWPDQGTRTYLRERAIQDEYREVRQEAIRALSAHWPDEETCGFLRARAANDRDVDLRKKALAGLARLSAGSALLAVASGGRDWRDPFPDPREPLSKDRLRRTCRILSRSEGEIRQLVDEASKELGWDLMKGLRPEDL